MNDPLGEMSVWLWLWLWRMGGEMGRWEMGLWVWCGVAEEGKGCGV